MTIGHVDGTESHLGAACANRAPDSGTGSAVPDAASAHVFPWAGNADETACNFAFAHLANNIRDRVTIDGRIHAETLLSICGAIAGYAAQRAALNEIADRGDFESLSQIKVVTTRSGHKYSFGESLDRALLPQSEADAPRKLWAHAAGAAVASGLAPGELPSLDAMFAHVTDVLDTDDDGYSSAGKRHRSSAPVKDLLKLYWPLAEMCFDGRFPSKQTAFGETAVESRPMIAAAVASGFIREVSTVLHPAIALRIVMESAIYASRLDSTEIEARQSAA